MDVLDERRKGGQVVSAYFDSEVQHEISGDVTGFGKEIHIVLVETRMPEVAVEPNPFNNRPQQIPSHQIFLADTNPIPNLALLHNNLPHLFPLIAIPEQHIQQDMRAIHQSMVELLERALGVLLREGLVEAVELAAEDGDEGD